jgi:succinoglycan biosynthesis transport protein ExoP
MSTHYPDDDDSRAARRDQWGLIRRWRWIAGGLVVGIVLAGAYSQTRPVHYTATTQVAVRQVVTDPFNSNGTNLTVAISMPTEKEIASSQGVADVAKATLKSSQSTRSLLNHLSVSIPNGTQILSFAYQSDSPDLAVKGAQAFANAYLKSRQAQIQATVTNIASTLAKQIKTLQAQSSSLASKIAVADTAEKAALGSQRSGVDIQLAGAETSASALASLDTTPGYITSQATRPQNPTGVTTKILVILGALLGLIAGIIVAQIRAGSDGRVFDAEEVAEILGVPLLNRAPLKLSALWRYTDSPGRNSSRTVEQLREIALRMIDGTSALSRRNVLIVSGSRRDRAHDRDRAPGPHADPPGTQRDRRVRGPGQPQPAPGHGRAAHPRRRRAALRFLQDHPQKRHGDAGEVDVRCGRRRAQRQPQSGPRRAHAAHGRMDRHAGRLAGRRGRRRRRHPGAVRLRGRAGARPP